MGKRLSQLNEVEQVSSTDYLLVDGEGYLESKKILIKNIDIKNFNTKSLDKDLEGKQEVLIDGKNIKKINGQSILGEGEIQIQGGGSASSLVRAPEYSPSSIIISQAKDNIAGSAGFEWIKVSKNKNGSGYDYICAENSKSELKKLKEAWIQAKGLDNKNYYLSFYAVNPNNGEQKETSHRSDGSLYIIDIDPDNCIIKGNGYYDGWTPEDGSNNGWIPIYEGDYSKLGQGSTIRAIDFPTIGTIEAVEYAVSMGHNNKVIGDASVGLGRNNIVNGSYAFAAGRDNYVGYNGTSFGRRNKVKGQMGTALGQENEILGHNDTAIGTGLKDNGSSKNQLMTGRFNIPDADALFIAGNGSSNTDRSNALIIKQDGSIVDNHIKDGDVFASLYSSKLCGSIWDGTIANSFSNGSGTEDNPYQITNGAQLAKMVQDQASNKYYQLQNDIYLNDISIKNWKINQWINVSNLSFTGNFDGQNYGIYGLYIDNSTYTLGGIFGTIANGSIKNLKIDYVHIRVSGNAGSLCGIMNIGTISNIFIGNCTYVATLGNAGAGGLIGYVAGNKQVSFVDIISLVNKSNLNTNGETYKKNGILGQTWGTGGVNITFDNCISLSSIWCAPYSDYNNRASKLASPNNNYYFDDFNELKEGAYIYEYLGQPSQQNLYELLMLRGGLINPEVLNEKQDKFATVSKTEDTVALIISDFSDRPPRLIFGEGMAQIETLDLKLVGKQEISFEGLNTPDDGYNINVNKLRIRNLADPIFNKDAVNKSYFDTAIGNIETALDSIIALQNSIIEGDV